MGQNCGNLPKLQFLSKYGNEYKLWLPFIDAFTGVVIINTGAIHIGDANILDSSVFPLSSKHRELISSYFLSLCNMIVAWL